MKVRTVLGDIDGEELGFTYTHEHLYAVPPKSQKDRDLELSNVENSTNELKIFRNIGGNSLVEGSTIDYGRNVKILKEISEEAGVNVIATTGFNKHIYYPKWVEEISIDELVNLFVKEITEGIDGTTIKAGQLKTGSWYNLIHPLEKKVTIALGRAHLKTNCPIWVHTENGTMGIEMLDILENEGVNLENVVVGHSDRNPDYWYFKKLLNRGAYVGFDGPGKVKYYPDSVRIDLLKKLIKEGYTNQIMISGDMGRRSYLESYGGGPGFNFIKNKFIPRMLDEGISEEQINTIFIDNPKHWLAKF